MQKYVINRRLESVNQLRKYDYSRPLGADSNIHWYKYNDSIYEIEHIISTTNLYVDVLRFVAMQLLYIPSLHSFKHIRSIFCNDNLLLELPEIPNSVQVLVCNSNILKSLPKLHDGLTTLVCFDNYISDLPELPGSLEVLKCGRNNISHLPSRFPDSLEFIDVSRNHICELPATLPRNLIRLYCGYNKLTSISYGLLPSKLTLFNCNENSINWIGSLPNSLQILSCSNNNLRKLPSPLPKGLNEIRCSYNKIDVFPMMPTSMTILECHYCGTANTRRDIPKHITSYSDIYPNLEIKTINIVNKFRYTYYYNKYKWRFLEYYAMIKMHPDNIKRILNQDYMSVDKLDMYF